MLEVFLLARQTGKMQYFTGTTGSSLQKQIQIEIALTAPPFDESIVLCICNNIIHVEILVVQEFKVQFVVNPSI